MRRRSDVRSCYWHADLPTALPKIELFRSLHEMISAYPSPPSLREPLLDHLHAHLLETLPSLPAAIKLHATRYLTPDLSGEALVDALRTANDVLSESVRMCPAETREGVATVYAEFIEEWCGKKDVDDNLVSSCLSLLPHLDC